MTNDERRTAIGAFVLFALLAVAHTWPLAAAPGRLSRNDNADTILNEWILAWIAHAAVTDPAHLFDANIFYPERRTLAFSEELIVPGVMGAPLIWAGQSPVLVYNVLLLAGLALTGWAGWLLVWRWTNDVAAGILAGVILAFNAHTLTRLPHLQALHGEFLPLALLAFDRTLAEPNRAEPPRGDRTRCALLLALFVALQGLTSYYTLVFTTIALAVAWVVRPDAWRAQVAARLALAATLALVILLPFLVPYARLGQVRPLDEVAYYAATWREYLSTPARLHYGSWSARWIGGTTALFPGVTALAFAASALGTGVAIRSRQARMALAFGLAGLALSFGPHLPGYVWLYRVFLPLQGIRNVARFGYLAIVALAILAGFGLAAVRRRWSGVPGWAIAVVAIVCANADAFAAPIGFHDAEPVSPLHAHLRGTNAIVAEFPFYAPDRVFREAPYLLHASLHWCPMLNGYSGFVPGSYVEHARELAGFPDARSIAGLRRFGVTHVFVHADALRRWSGDRAADAVGRTSALRRLATDGELSLYEIIGEK